jgi:hypothetical protein
MSTWIVISCILAGGQHIDPSGHYRDFAQCEARARHFETEALASEGLKHPLCWCHQVPKPNSKPDSKLTPRPKSPIRYSPDRKAPL